MAVIEAWQGENVTMIEIERQLARMRTTTNAASPLPTQRTSVMTHIAWVPPPWVEAAERTLEGMEDSHPSRTIALVPVPDDASGLDVNLSVRCFTSSSEQSVASEVIWLRLRGDRTIAPASLVLPLALSDLPIFLRWRGDPPFGAAHFQQLIGIADRLVVDSSEWEELRYLELSEVFDGVGVTAIGRARRPAWVVVLRGC